MDMRCCVMHWWQGLDLCIVIYDWFFVYNMDNGLYLLVFHGLVMNHRLLMVHNFLLMEDWLFLDYSSRCHLRMMEHSFVNNRMLDNLLLNHVSWLNDIGRLNNMGFLLNDVSWLFIMMGHFGDNRMLVQVSWLFII